MYDICTGTRYAAWVANEFALAGRPAHMLLPGDHIVGADGIRDPGALAAKLAAMEAGRAGSPGDGITVRVLRLRQGLWRLGINLATFLPLHEQFCTRRRHNLALQDDFWRWAELPAAPPRT